VSRKEISQKENFVQKAELRFLQTGVTEGETLSMSYLVDVHPLLASVSSA